MRLIDADAIKWRDGTDPCDPWVEMSFVKYDDIENMPTIEAEPVRHGTWIKSGGNKYPVYTCSECKYDSNTATIHCPNCGAKMDGCNA